MPVHDRRDRGERVGTRVRAALARPDAYPDNPATVEVRETHISWVFLAGDRAYKLKKPVVLDFLDYGTPERRHRMCREEVRLNRRLAPDLYLGVRGVRLTASGAELTGEDDADAVDFVVEMRRYDERDTLAARLERGELRRGQVAQVGRVLAGFHAAASPAAAVRAPALAAERRFDRNLHELLADTEQRGEIERIQALERFAHAYVGAHATTFQTRATTGRIRDGHGDLRAEHVLVAAGCKSSTASSSTATCACSTWRTILPSSSSISPRRAASASATCWSAPTARPAGTRARTI